VVTKRVWHILARIAAMLAALDAGYSYRRPGVVCLLVTTARPAVKMDEPTRMSFEVCTRGTNSPDASTERDTLGKVLPALV